jgi:hypothetical protein
VDKNRSVNVITEPPVEPVTLTDLYEFLKLDPEGSPPSHPSDATLRGMITAARTAIEARTRRALVQQTLELVLPSFPNSLVLFSASRYAMDADDYEARPHYIELMSPPLIEVLTVKYYDENNTLQTWASSNYFISEGTLPARLNTTDGQVWPTTFQRPDAVFVRYVAGYPPLGSPGDGPDLAANVPEAIKLAIKIHVQLTYDELAVDKRNALKNLMSNLLEPYIVRTY